ncbi:MAG: MFS transporter [Acidobacteriota bacterium]
MNSATYSELLRRNKNFRRLWTGQFISELGTWFSFIAELGVVRLLSGSALVATALLVARLLPFLLAAPIAGVLTDRFSRKRIMIIADLLRAAVAMVYLIAIPLRSPWIIVGCSALMTTISMFFEAAKNAAMPNMVTSRELLTANVMMFSTRFLQYTLGAAMGGATAAQFGYSVAFLVNSLSFVASAVFIILIPEEVMRKSRRESEEAASEIDPLSAESCASAPIAGSEQPVETARFFKDLREGLGYIWVTPFVRGIILLNVGWATGGGMVNLLFDQMGAHTFAHDDLGDWNVSALFTASGAGLFLGMVLARRAGAWATEERRAGLFIGWSLVAQGALLSIAGLMPSLALMAVFVAAARLILGAEFGVQETFMMRVLPDHYRGRVFTTDRSLELSTMAIATVASGWLIKWLGPRAVMVISGALSASPGVVWLLALSLTDFRVPTRAVRESYGD